MIRTPRYTHNAPAIAAAMDTPDRLAAAYTLRSRAYQWAGACTDTADLLAAMEIVQWADRHHAAEVAR